MIATGKCVQQQLPPTAALPLLDSGWQHYLHGQPKMVSCTVMLSHAQCHVVPGMA